MLSVFIMYFVIRKGIFPIIEFPHIIISCKNGKKSNTKNKTFFASFENVRIFAAE